MWIRLSARDSIGPATRGGNPSGIECDGSSAIVPLWRRWARLEPARTSLHTFERWLQVSEIEKIRAEAANRICTRVVAPTLSTGWKPYRGWQTSTANC
jgi:hypothetical protein